LKDNSKGTVTDAVVVGSKVALAVDAFPCQLHVLSPGRSLGLIHPQQQVIHRHLPA
jgi:hypothetical protein